MKPRTFKIGDRVKFSGIVFRKPYRNAFNYARRSDRGTIRNIPDGICRIAWDDPRPELFERYHPNWLAKP